MNRGCLWCMKTFLCWKAGHFIDRGFKNPKFQWQPKVSLSHGGCKNCWITAAWAKSDDGEQESAFRDANWAEKLLATSVHVAPQKLQSEVFLMLKSWYWPLAKIASSFKVNYRSYRSFTERMTTIKRGKVMQTSRRRKHGDDMKRKWGGVHMWVFPDHQSQQWYCTRGTHPWWECAHVEEFFPRDRQDIWSYWGWYWLTLASAPADQK